MVDRDMVADQPAGAILFVGVALAVVLGLTFRGLIHPAKIRAMMESAAGRIHPELHVTFDNARVSLADGVVPRLSVVIEQVRMTSTNPCWMAPRLFADEIRLPLSLSSWLTGKSPIRRVEAGEVELRLTAARPATCGDQAQLAAPAEPEKPSGVVSLIKRPGARPGLKSGGDVEALEIGRLVVVAEAGPLPGTIDLEDFEFRVRSARPRVYHLRARTRLLKDRVDDLIHANIEAEYKEFPEKSLNLNFFGNWREGSYTLTARFDPATEHAAIEARSQHLPLGQLLAVLRRFGVVGTDFEPRRSWLSFNTRIEGPLRALAKQPLALGDVRLEGDLAELQIPKLDIASLQPFRMAPSRIEVKSLDVDRLIEFLHRPHPSHVLNKVGRFSGVAEITDERNFRLVGEHSGLEFIFANQGRRELQAVGGLHGWIRRENGRWRAEIDRADVNQGSFRGDVRLAGDEDLNELNVSVRADELTLRSAVQSLMTQGGEIAPLQGQITARFVDRKLAGLRGSLRVPRIRLAGLEIDRFQAQFDERDGGIRLVPRIDRFVVARDTRAWEVFGQLAPDAWVHDGKLSLSSVGGTLRLKDLNEVRWTKFGAKIDGTRSTMTTDGGWDAGGRLSGSVTVRGERAMKWRLEGTRDKPILAGSKP